MGSVTSKRKEYKISDQANDACTSKSQDESQDDDIIEEIVCKEEDLKENSMKVVQLKNHGNVLLVKESGKISALGTKCTHYGAPLIKGVLCNGRIRCPWHGACFNSTTGDIEDFPGLDSLPLYKAEVVNGDVKVSASKLLLSKNKRSKTSCKRNNSDGRQFVVIGGGGAAQACVETLRQEGFTGQLVLISKEKYQPYDRPKLSKVLDAKISAIALRDQHFFESNDIDLWLQKEVSAIDTKEKKIVCNDGSSINYDHVMIATGGKPRSLNVPGANLKNICILRTPDDANYIVEQASKKNVVIIGTSFIGMEVAAALSDKANSVTIVGSSNIPFRAVLGESVGQRLQKLHEEKGIIFYNNASAEEFIGNNDVLSAVKLSTGDELPADLCVLGIGVEPSTTFLKDSGIEMNSRGYVVVDKFMKTQTENVYACGDIVEFPLSINNDQRVSIGHWQIALAHGRTAALNMLNKNVELHTVPFFWCTLFGKSLRYAGYTQGFDDVIIDGSLDGLKFVAYYTKDGNVSAVAAMNNDPVTALFASLLQSGKSLMKDEIMSNPSAWFEKIGYSSAE